MNGPDWLMWLGGFLMGLGAAMVTLGIVLMAIS